MCRRQRIIANIEVKYAAKSFPCRRESNILGRGNRAPTRWNRISQHSRQETIEKLPETPSLLSKRLCRRNAVETGVAPQNGLSDRNTKMQVQLQSQIPARPVFQQSRQKMVEKVLRSVILSAMKNLTCLRCNELEILRRSVRRLTDRQLPDSSEPHLRRFCSSPLNVKSVGIPTD